MVGRAIVRGIGGAIAGGLWAGGLGFGFGVGALCGGVGLAVIGVPLELIGGALWRRRTDGSTGELWAEGAFTLLKIFLVLATLVGGIVWIVRSVA
jgi:hypothetical protein